MKMKKYFFFLFFTLSVIIISPKEVYAQCDCYDGTDVWLRVNPSAVDPGDLVTFIVEDADGATQCVHDDLGGIDTDTCDDRWHPDGRIRLGDPDLRFTTCTAPSFPGVYTFRHYWQVDASCCDEPLCSVSTTYTVNDSAPPPGTPEGLLCNADTGIETAIGCIPVNNTTLFAGFLLRWGFGIGGGIAFILIIAAGFQIITSGGFPDKVQAGKQLLTAAISGLLLIIFSVFILELFGVRILRLPGF